MDATDFFERAKERLSLQYRGKPKIEALLRIVSRQCEELELALLQLYVDRAIATAVGQQLDTLGSVVGLPRNGLVDATYQAHIRARIRVNKSNTTIDQVMAVFRVAQPTATLTLTEYFPAAFVLKIEAVTLTEGIARLYRALLTLAKAAGVETKLLWQPYDDANTFTFDGGAGLGFAAHPIGGSGGYWSGAL